MKRIKKLAALMMAAVMVLAMSIPVFATETNDPTYTLTIKTVNNHTYKIYQLATGKVSSDKGKLSDIEVGKAAKTGTTVEAIEGLVGKDGATLGDAAWALVNENATDGVYEVVGDGKENKITLPGGYYVIQDTFTSETSVADGDTLSRFMVQLVADEIVTPKTTTVKPDKKIVEGNLKLENSEASIGDDITYELKGTLPDMEGYKSMKFVFVDTMDKGLTPQLKVNDEINGKVGSLEAKFKVTAVTPQEDGTTLVRIALVNAFSYKDMEGAPAGCDVTVQIKATLNEKAEVVSKDNKNKLKIDFNNRPEYEGKPGDDFEPEEPKGTTAEVTVQTFTTSLTINKVDKDTKEALKGAEFKLTGDTVNVGFVTGQKYVPTTEAPEEYSGSVWYKLADGAYTTTEPTDDTSNKYDSTTDTYALIDVDATTYEKAQMEAQAFVDEDGVVTFTGLGKGKYTLTEVTTPDGYNTLAPVEFEVEWTKENGFTVKLTKAPEGVSIGNNGGLLSSTVPNAKGSLLPSTGGIGTTIFYVVGAILVIGAGIVLVAKKRMSREV